MAISAKVSGRGKQKDTMKNLDCHATHPIILRRNGRLEFNVLFANSPKETSQPAERWI